MWINRIFSKRIQDLAAQRPALLLTGARQTGKTSLLKHCFPSHTYVSLDLPSLAELAEKSPEEFLTRYPAPLIVDEVQYAPRLLRHLKARIDERRNERARWILTGSQKFQLMRGVSESLAGRIAVLELETLSAQEIQTARPELSLADILYRGGFPELAEDLSLSPRDFYASYVATYLERDLRALVQVGNLRDFERFLRLCATRSGQLLNKSDLARDAGISHTTAGHWLSALQASNIVFLLEPWFTNRSKSIAKTPKLYISDTGLLSYFWDLKRPEDLRVHPRAGAIWETFVYAELRKTLRLAAEERSLYFFRDRDWEADFLRTRGERFDLIEAKWTETPDEGDASGLIKVEKRLGASRVLSKTVVCRTAHSFPLGSDTRAQNLPDLLEHLSKS
jgi:predicted AAA+ superfamily ATPase